MMLTKDAHRTADVINAELSAAVGDRPCWTLHYLGTPTLMAMYTLRRDVRGFVFPGRHGGWTWFVLQDGHGCVRSEGDVEPAAEKTIRLIEEFVDGLEMT